MSVSDIFILVIILVFLWAHCSLFFNLIFLLSWHRLLAYLCMSLFLFIYLFTYLFMFLLITLENVKGEFESLGELPSVCETVIEDGIHR